MVFSKLDAKVITSGVSYPNVCFAPRSVRKLPIDNQT